MKKEEILELNNRKLKGLKEKLVKVTDYTKIKEGQLLFHEMDNNIFNINEFVELTDDNTILWYKNNEGLLHNMSANGWYYHDESIADEIEDYFTPKLYSVTDKLNPKQHVLLIALNEDHLKKCYTEEMLLNNMTKEDFLERFIYSEIQYVDGFKIKVE